MDSGASFHSNSCRKIIKNYIGGDFRKVHLADDKPLKIMGKGGVRVKLLNGTMRKLKNVRYILGLKRNLISIGQLDEKGYSTTFTDHM